MNTAELYLKLKEAYTEQNLNVITHTLINLYKEQQFASLQRIAGIISETVEVEITPEGKGFSKFMKLYHPDRLDYFRSEIDRMAGEDDFDGLLGFSHILLLTRIEEVAATLESYEDIDYSPVYEWDFNTDGFSVISDHETGTRNISFEAQIKRRRYSFYEAMQMRMYGNTTLEFPVYYLEDIDEFELALSEMDNLEGVQFCKHALTLDLSSNLITDITELSELTLLQDLNLSDNHISDIGALVHLKDLKALDLSSNSIDDISPLFNLEKLEYVNIAENKVPPAQIEELRDLGITVVTDI